MPPGLLAVFLFSLPAPQAPSAVQDTLVEVGGLKPAAVAAVPSGNSSGAPW